MRALDLFCGAGGASMGLHRAGFEVIGVDHKPQPHYPFAFVQADALNPPFDLGQFDLIWASPPCQAYVALATGEHPRLIEPVRELLAGRMYVIENVENAPLRHPVRLCGSMFNLNVRRHRCFEASFFMFVAECVHPLQDEIRAYYGNPGWLAWRGKSGRELLRGSLEQAPDDMGIDWMTWGELREAIPPAYAEFIGRAALASMDIPLRPQNAPATASARLRPQAAAQQPGPTAATPPE